MYASNQRHDVLFWYQCPILRAILPRLMYLHGSALSHAHGLAGYRQGLCVLVHMEILQFSDKKAFAVQNLTFKVVFYHSKVYYCKAAELIPMEVIPCHCKSFHCQATASLRTSALLKILV